MNSACHICGHSSLVLYLPSSHLPAPPAHPFFQIQPQGRLSRADMGGVRGLGLCLGRCLGSQVRHASLDTAGGVGPSLSASPKLLDPEPRAAYSQPWKGRFSLSGHCPDEKKKPGRWLGIGHPLQSRGGCNLFNSSLRREALPPSWRRPDPISGPNASSQGKVSYSNWVSILFSSWCTQESPVRPPELLM